jgi:hypothetical protein
MAELENPKCYEEWLALDLNQKEQVARSWDVYQKEGFGFALCAAGRLILATNCKVFDVQPGLYHGGEWVLHATVAKDDLPHRAQMLEQEFEGFRVIWMEQEEVPPPPDSL